MGNTLALMFEALARTLHQSIDPVPERLFYLVSGVVLIVVGTRVRRSLQDY